MKVSITDQTTGGASKDLAATQLLVQGSTIPTCLRGAGLIDQYNPAPGVLASLGQEVLAESIVRPGHHGSGCLGAESPVVTQYHPLSIELGQ